MLLRDLILTWFLLGAMPAAAAPAAGWRLRSQVSVHTASVLLGDLLEPGVPVSREITKTVIASAPQPGTLQTWTASELAASLRAAGLDPSDFAIPRRLEVQRVAALIPQAAVLAAVAKYLRRPVAPADLVFRAPQSTAANPAITVIAAHPDPIHGRLDLICRDDHDPAVLPFTVSVAGAALSKLAAAPATPIPHGPVLVRPGHPAELTIAASGFSLDSPVEPLQAGRLGDEIHVRSAVTHALLDVVVAGPNQVKEAAHAH